MLQWFTPLVAAFALAGAADADLARGDQAMKKKDFVAASAAYLSARSLDPKDPRVYQKLAQLSEVTGDFGTAGALFSQCRVIDPKSAACRAGVYRAEARVKNVGRGRR